MIKKLAISIALAAGLFLSPVLVHAEAAYPDGCTANTAYSSTTGHPCTLPDCSPGDLFSGVTGKPCTGLTYPAGCWSSVGYSITTGTKCDGSTVVTQPTGQTAAVTPVQAPSVAPLETLAPISVTVIPGDGSQQGGLYTLGTLSAVSADSYEVGYSDLKFHFTSDTPKGLSPYNFSLQPYVYSIGNDYGGRYVGNLASNGKTISFRGTNLPKGSHVQVVFDSVIANGVLYNLNVSSPIISL